MKREIVGNKKSRNGEKRSSNDVGFDLVVVALTVVGY